MKYKKHPLRLFLFSLLLLCLLTGLTGIARSPRQVEAAPQMQAIATDVVISEFRFLGPQGDNDEFIELYNPTNAAIDISGWLIRGSSNSGSISTRATIPPSTVLSPGGHYLIVNSSASSGLVALQNLTYGTGITSDGGVALTLSDGTTIKDAVGLSSGSAYKEGTVLNPLSGTANQSYERKPGDGRNCVDTNNNVSDFVLNAASINPQNSGSAPVSCLYVTDVNSTVADGTYSTAGINIDITVTFTGTVFADSPTLQLETGVTDRSATYLSGSGTNTLIFRYTTAVGDYSTDLDYVSATALGPIGSIYDFLGNAVLTLPTPAAANSLGANKNIVINVDDGAPPSVLSIRRQTPATTPTNNDNLIFRVTFSENISVAPGSDVDITDFVVHTNSTPPTTTATIINATGSGNVYDVTISGGDLAGFDGIVGLDLSSSATIQDQIGNDIVLPENLSAANDETYLLDNLAPTITVNQATTQADPTGVTPVNFTVVFSEPITVSTFTTADITQPASPGAVTWTISNPSNDRRNFNLVATIITTTNVVLTPSIGVAAAITDDAGNTNSASTSTDNSVTFGDTTAPTVTITRASGQAATTTVLPVRFTVTFSEAINVALFTPADITQSATSSPASGITWTITNSGNNRTFTISATVVTVGGNITPFISANRVTDVAGNGNTDTTSTANVNYGIPPTPTITPTRTVTPIRTATRTRTPTIVPTAAPAQLVAINEFVPRPGHDWNNDGEVNVQDEYIEIINHGTINVSLSGWSLDDEANLGSTPYRLPSVTIRPGERLVFYGSETGLLLSDGGDGVRLLKPNGQLIDAYNYTVARYSDQSYCRLPDDGGLDDWNQNCYPTPGLQNSLSGEFVSPTNGLNESLLCPIADTLPEDFVIAECAPYGNNIWRRAFWDNTGWLGEKMLPNIDSRWDVFAD